MTTISTSLKRKVLTLVVTQSCNLDCMYCYQSHKSRKNMRIDIAKAAIDKHINSNDFDEIEIDLFGGEPFLRADFIRELCEWTWNQKYSKPMIFFVDTNGTKIHGEIQKWLKQYKDYILLGLSLDGTPETHNHNRSKSYYNIDIDFFLKMYPNQPVRMTIAPETIGDLAQDIIHLHKLGFSVTSSFAQGVKWDMNKNKSQLITELKKLCDFYQNNPQITPCSLFEMSLPLVNSRRIQKKWCGCGDNMVTVDIDGKEYPCQLFLPSAMPNLNKWNKIDFSENQDYVDHDCDSCIIKNICPTCYGANFIATNDIKKRDKSLCEFYKIQASANSYLKGLMIENGSFKSDNLKDTYNLIKAISKIQKHIIN